MTEVFYSIIVPVYNVEKYLPQCMESVLRQTFENFEVILVDDGSNDRSGEICDEFAQKDKRIRVIHKKNGGLSSARNAGIREAQGTYILFMDSDDYWCNNTMLAQLFAWLHGKEELAVWKYCKCEEDEAICKDAEEAMVYEFFFPKDYKCLLGKGILFGSAWYEAIPRAWFHSNNLYFEEGVVSEDIEWFMRLLECVGHVALFDAFFYVYRVRQGSISHTRSERAVLDISHHLDNMAAKQAADPRPWRRCYIGEQAANFVIVLSRRSDCVTNVAQYSRYFPLMKGAVRRRSKAIYLAYRLLGATTLRLLVKRVGWR